MIPSSNLHGFWRLLKMHVSGRFLYKIYRLFALIRSATGSKCGKRIYLNQAWTWWRHQMETFSTLLALCARNSSVTGEFPSQRPVTRSFDVFFDLRLNKRLGKQSRHWWLGTQSRLLWRHCDDIINFTESNITDLSESFQISNFTTS